VEAAAILILSGSGSPLKAYCNGKADLAQYAGGETTEFMRLRNFSTIIESKPTIVPIKILRKC
jgi:hypothetical protein